MRALRLSLILIILAFLTPNLAFSQIQPIEQPKTLEQAQEIGQKALETTQKGLPGAVGRVWKEEVLPVWKKMWDAVKAPADKAVTWLQNVWQEFLRRVGFEVDTRKPTIKEEFEKEKKELKQEAPKVGKSLWERFIELTR